MDKNAGQPCTHLQRDFRCGIHEGLNKRGLKGCLAFDCFGAGQQVTQVSFAGQDWRRSPDTAPKMFQVFTVMMRLHELLWYMTEALTLQQARSIHDRIRSLLEEMERLTTLSPDALLALDLEKLRASADTMLLKTSELVRAEVHQELNDRSRHRKGSGGLKKSGRGADLIGADLRKTDLRGAHLRGAYLIAADMRGNDLRGSDFIGADLRDADLRGADLSHSVFLTQNQINSARGDRNTKLPSSLLRPEHWNQMNDQP